MPDDYPNSGDKQQAPHGRVLEPVTQRVRELILQVVDWQEGDIEEEWQAWAEGEQRERPEPIPRELCRAEHEDGAHDEQASCYQFHRIGGLGAELPKDDAPQQRCRCEPHDRVRMPRLDAKHVQYALGEPDASAKVAVVVLPTLAVSKKAAALTVRNEQNRKPQRRTQDCACCKRQDKPTPLPQHGTHDEWDKHDGPDLHR